MTKKYKTTTTEIMFDIQDLDWMNEIMDYSYHAEQEHYFENCEKGEDHMFHSYDKFRKLRDKLENQLK